MTDEATIAEIWDSPVLFLAALMILVAVALIFVVLFTVAARAVRLWRLRRALGAFSRDVEQMRYDVQDHLFGGLDLSTLNTPPTEEKK